MLTIGIVMGGYSGESVVSLKSGDFFYSQIDKTKYKVYKVHVLNEGWTVAIDEQTFVSINKEDFSFYLKDKKIVFDALLNTIHGTPGENGLIQAYWQLLNIPHSGCSFYNSALTFNKKDTLSVLRKYNIPMAKSVYIIKGQEINADEIVSKVGLPCFVKPNQSGSSLGISKVKGKEELLPAIDIAYKEDSSVLIESFLEGKEVSVGVMKFKGETLVVGTTEIVSKNEFFDYEAKYLGASEEITPARLNEVQKEYIYKEAANIYALLNMTGFSRIDFIIVEDTPHFLEINTTPGCSPASIFPQQVKYAGYNFSELLDNEISLALQKFK